MTRRLQVLIASAVLISSGACLSADAPAGEVPFEMLGHLILVKARINNSERDFNFVVDTGGVACIDKDLAGELELKQRGMMAKIDTLDLPGFRIESVFCFTTFDFALFRALGTPIHGIIGSNLMERFKVTFDFKGNSIVFSSDTSSVLYDDGGLLLSFRNHPVNSAPLVQFKIGAQTIEGMIDTGQPYPVVLPLASLENFRESEVSDCIRSRGLMKKWPMTTADHNYLARLNTFTFGDMAFEHVICLFGELPPILSMPLIGTGFLSQFEITINYPKDEMLMIPYPDMKMDDNVFSAGVNLGLSEVNEVIVLGIWENSPAAERLQVGDTLVSFDSRKATPENLIELMTMLDDDSVESIEVEIEREGQKRTVVLQKAMLF